MKYLIGLMSLICPLILRSALGFVNIEALRQVPGEGFVGSTGLQFNGQNGNTNKFTLRGSTLGIFRFIRDEFLYTADYRYGTSEYVRDTNRGHFHLRHTFFHREARAYEVFVQSGYDEFKDLNSRNLVGGNLRTRLVQAEARVLYLGTGLFYEYEDFTRAQDEETVRGNIYLSYNHSWDKTFMFSTTIYYQPDLRDPVDYRLRLQSGLDIQVTEALNFDVDVGLVHDTGLPKGVKPTDTDYLFGFSIRY